ncbi:sorbosone dehydrogenase family protein [Intrasporangium sp.]|uniref:PQQ-dependent sugar dehydrogenase n=1 Tax=Intrasporangium sp. TaxID=1925024 RepID=UPI00264A18A7|nr:PQQ-dependent sugar dehydrogenase [Intrasporangium sp.]
MAGAAALAVLAAACTSPTGEGATGSPAPTTASPAVTGQTSAPTTSTASPSGSTTASPAAPTTPPVPLDKPAFAVTGGLDIPWSIAMLPDGSALVSERNTGDIHWVPAPGRPGKARVVGHLDINRQPGEGGLLGLAVPPDFAADPVFYAYYTSDSDNRIAAVPWRGDRIGTPHVIFTGIPSGTYHNGGRIAFGPDGYLYVGTGEAGDKPLAQNLGSLGGKILRITTAGKPAPGNPFGGSPIWTYGHRNVQGLAWDGQGRMWASELGQDTWDELNLIRPGRNYGWPEVEGRADNPDYVDPVAQWRPAEMSPSGIAIGPDGAVYIAALRGQSVWRVPIRADGSAGTSTRHLEGTYGRIRDVHFVGGRAWILTSNGGDDRLLSLPPSDLGVAR